MKNTITIIILLLCFVGKAQQDVKRIGFSQCTQDEWRSSMDNEMRLEAQLHPNIKLDIRNAFGSIDRQIDDINQYVNEQVDLIIVSPFKSKPVTPAIENAIDAGIPVLVVDRMSNSDKFTAYIGGDNYEVGKIAAKYIAADTNKKTATIIEIKGDDASSPANDRNKGFRDELKKYRNISIIGEVQGNWGRYLLKDALHKLLDSLTTPPDYIFAHNDVMAHSAWEVAKTYGIEKQIKFIGVDGLNSSGGGIEMVKEGTLKATILYPTGGNEAIDLALKILNGTPVPKYNTLQTTVIDAVNADILKNQFDKIAQHQEDISQQIKIIEEKTQITLSQSETLRLLIILLIATALLTAYSIYSVFSSRRKNKLLEKNNAEIKKQRNQIEQIAENLKDSNAARDNFFTGLSHEFKTPITLILSSVESLAEQMKNTKSKLFHEVDLVYNNANRLLRLINQLLDFRKMEDRKFVLRASNTNLSDFSKKILKDFDREAKRLGVIIHFESVDDSLEAYIDRNLMDKVYFNLLSNALKFTPKGGKISIAINRTNDNKRIQIIFSDTGIGIPKKDLNGVFKPFFKGSNNNRKSSGVGLLLSKQFVELHRGKIKVESSEDGTTFTIQLFSGSSHLDDDEVIVEGEIVEETIIDFSKEIEEVEIFSEASSSKQKEKLLIIEDNSELITFLSNKLSTTYQTVVSDGTDAIDKAFELIPDIILCDVNLPDKDGFELCSIFKNDLRTSHIPVVLLTALGTKNAYLKGLESGADLYLTKPFSFSILTQSLTTLLYNREILRTYFTKNIYKLDSSISYENSEIEFISKITGLIKDKIDDSTFGVEQLADTLEISRVQLYRKIKAVMGISISDYIQSIKLDHAKKLLETTDLSISDVAYSAGFSSPNYFSTSFKGKFGKTPKSFRLSFSN